MVSLTHHSYGPGWYKTPMPGILSTDPVGNTGPVSSDTYTLDTTGPATTITSRPPSPGNDLTPAWSFTTEAGATSGCRLSGPAGLVSAWGSCAGSFTFDLTGGPDGGPAVEIRQYYRIPVEPNESITFNSAQDQLIDLLRETVRSHLAADVDMDIAANHRLDLAVHAATFA